VVRAWLQHARGGNEGATAQEKGELGDLEEKLPERKKAGSRKEVIEREDLYSKKNWLPRRIVYRAK